MSFKEKEIFLQIFLSTLKTYPSQNPKFNFNFNTNKYESALVTKILYRMQSDFLVKQKKN